MADDRIEDRETGISMRLIREWKPEPIERQIERDIALMNLLRQLEWLRLLPCSETIH